MSISVAGDGLLLSQKGDLVVADGTAEGRLAVGSDGQILTASSTDSLGVKWINAPAATQKWATISYAVVTASTTGIVFDNIPSTYTDLKLICAPRSTTTSSHAVFRVYANAFTSHTTYYDYYNDTTVATDTVTANGSIYMGNGAVASAGDGHNSLFVIDIMNYANTTKGKEFIFKGGYAQNTTSAGLAGFIGIGGGNINNTAAITKLTIHCGTLAAPQIGQTSWALLMGVIR
jgi:hypothetical protein